MHPPTMDVRPSPRRALLFALMLSMTACKTPSKTGDGYENSPDSQGQGGDGFPKRPTVKVRKDDKADQALAQAIQQAESAPRKQAAEAFLSVRKTYPETTAGQEALYRAGVLFYDSQDYVNARKSFNELLFENPLYPQAQDAKRRLGKAALETGAYRDAYQTLSSLAERAEGAERLQLLQDAALAAEKAGLFGPALQIVVDLAGEAQTPEAQQAAAARVQQLVEGRAGFVDVARVAEGLLALQPRVAGADLQAGAHLLPPARLDAAAGDAQPLPRGGAPRTPSPRQAKELLARATRRVDVQSRGRWALLLPMTGKYKAVGEAVLRGVKLALNGSDVELVVKDTQGDVNLTGQAMEQLAFDEGAIAVLGPILGDDARRAALLAEELQVPLLTLTRQEDITGIGPLRLPQHAHQLGAGARHRRLRHEGEGLQELRHALPQPPLRGGAGQRLLGRRGGRAAARCAAPRRTRMTRPRSPPRPRSWSAATTWRTAATTSRACATCSSRQRHGRVPQAQGLREDARRRGAHHRLRGHLPPDEWKRVSLVAPALAVEDIVTNACDPRDLERIRKTTGKKNLKTVTLLGTNAWSSPRARSGLPELVERGGKFVTCSVYVDGFFVDSQRPGHASASCRPTARPTTTSAPGLLEAYGYDSARMVRQLIESKQAPRTRGDFREALASLKDFEGATGKTSFDDKREAQKPLFFLSITNKGVSELMPEQTAALGGHVRRPLWGWMGLAGARGVSPCRARARSGGLRPAGVHARRLRSRAGAWAWRTGPSSTARTSSGPWPSRRTARAWRTTHLAAREYRSPCGRSGPRPRSWWSGASTPPSSTWRRWPSPRTARCWRARVGMARCACSTRPPARPRSTLSTEEPLTAVAFHPSGGYLVVGSARGLVTALRVADLSFSSESRPHSDRVSALAFAPEGTLYSGGWDKRIRVYDTREETLRREQARLHFERRGGYAVVGGHRQWQGVPGAFALDARAARHRARRARGRGGGHRHGLPPGDGVAAHGARHHAGAGGPGPTAAAQGPGAGGRGRGGV